MSLSVTLCNNTSPAEKINKSLTAGNSFDCLLKEDCSVLRPVIKIKTSNDITGYNYMKIPGLNRCYFIDDIVSINNDIWMVSGHVDVLETYKNEILNNEAVIKRQANMFNTYLNDPEWKVYADENVVAYKMTSPFNKALKYVLTVAGS